jgi:hypothetical protein
MSILLQAATQMDVHAMDQVFTLKDVIYIVTLLAGAIFGYTKLQSSTGSNSKSIAELKRLHADDILHIQNGKRAIKKDLLVQIEKNNEISNKRIDKIQGEMKEMNTKSELQYNNLNEKLSRVLGYLEKIN